MAKKIPDVDLMFREDSDFVPLSTTDLFAGKRVVLFGLPGAFTPTCSTYQLPGFEEKFEEFAELGIEEIYCVSVNDAFVMNAWAKDLGIKNVKLLPDGNGEFTHGMDMLVPKFNIGFAIRSWRYAAVVNNMNIEWMAVEEGMGENVDIDPYEASTPEKVLEYLKSSNS